MERLPKKSNSDGLFCKIIVNFQWRLQIIDIFNGVYKPLIFSVGRFEKWLMWKCQDFQAILFLTHKSKIIGTIVLAL